MAHDTPLSRRSFPAPAEAASPDPDAALIALCAEWEAHRREYDTASKAYCAAEEAAVDKHAGLGMPALWAEVHADPAYKAAHRRVDKIVSKSHVLFAEIAQARAVTMKGVMAKANVVLGECLEGIDAELATNHDGIVPQFMALSLVRDLLEISKQGGGA